MQSVKIGKRVTNSITTRAPRRTNTTPTRMSQMISPSQTLPKGIMNIAVSKHKLPREQLSAALNKLSKKQRIALIDLYTHIEMVPRRQPINKTHPNLEELAQLEIAQKYSGKKIIQK
jgi:hypothetical protein